MARSKSKADGLLLLLWAMARVCKTRRRNAIHPEFFNLWTVTAAVGDGARVQNSQAQCNPS